MTLIQFNAEGIRAQSIHFRKHYILYFDLIPFLSENEGKQINLTSFVVLH